MWVVDMHYFLACKSILLSARHYTCVRLKYDVSTNSYSDNSHVKTHVPGFGKTSGVEYLNPGWINFAPNFHDMVEYFVDRGYVRGKSIRSAPYDWRLAAGTCTYSVQ